MVRDVAPFKATVDPRTEFSVDSVLQLCIFVVGILTHVLGQCPFRALIRNRRHTRIRTLISNVYRRNQYLEVYEEFTIIANEISIRISNIIVLNKN